jgi:hypothetical protein
MVGFRERTVIQTFKEDSHDNKFVVLHTLEGVSLPIYPYMPVYVDGKRFDAVGPRKVEINTKARTVTTTITVF